MVLQKKLQEKKNRKTLILPYITRNIVVFLEFFSKSLGVESYKTPRAALQKEVVPAKDVVGPKSNGQEAPATWKELVVFRCF